ncbi:hypothetical protein M5K25_001839 [Dendrobium thyrsiflorum]|uniref:Uncharacterized protein n=1 Tax=Dendrobium thyrsiflorum TaxID=117978 RepID=A0ABD0VRI7_DENTH
MGLSIETYCKVENLYWQKYSCAGQQDIRAGMHGQLAGFGSNVRERERIGQEKNWAASYKRDLDGMLEANGIWIEGDNINIIKLMQNYKSCPKSDKV